MLTKSLKGMNTIKSLYQMISDAIAKSSLTHFKPVFILVLAITVGCGRSNETIQHKVGEISEYEAVSHDLLEGSVLQFPLDYPVNDLQKMINRILPDTLISDSIFLNDKGDYLILKVLPIGKLLLNSYQNNLDASLPVEAIVHIKKKVAVFNIKNKKPLALRLRLDLHTELSVDENFELKTACSIQKIRWIETPKMKLAGIKVNLQKTINKQINQNSSVIADAICKALEESVPIEKEVQALWNLLNETHQVAKKPVDIWLSTVPNNLSANFDHKVLDTLRIVIHTNTGILISPLKGIKALQSQMLPQNKKAITDDKLDLRVSINMPYEYINLILTNQLEGQLVEYKGLAAELTNFTTQSEDDHLRLSFSTIGDVELELSAKAKPALNSKKELIFNDIAYEIVSDNPLMNSIEWMSNGTLDHYLKKESKIPIGHLLSALDDKIVNALDRSNLSSKIGLELSFDTIESDTTIYYSDRFEWIFSVEGSAHAYLSDSLVMK